MKHQLLIINPTAGQGRVKGSRDMMIHRLKKLGPLEVVETCAAGDANAAARQAAIDGFGRVIVAGGDGTCNEVVNAIAGTDTEFTLIPQGTGNVLARELGIPVDDVEAACDVVAGGKSLQIDLGIANQQYFTLMAGIGFDAAAVDRVNLNVKNVLGPAAYGIAGVSELLRHKSSRYSITMDGVQYVTEASLVVVCNASSYALRIKMASQASCSDGWLDVCVFESTNRMQLLSQALRLMLQGTQDGDPSVRCFRATTVRVACDRPSRVQLDGDVVGLTPTDIRVIPSALRVSVP